jgi:phosphate/phosphite/phosphonate ABC transporter binding protein
MGEETPMNPIRLRAPVSMSLVSLIAVVAALTGCHRGEPNGASPLIVAVPPTHAPADRAALERALSETAGGPVTIRVLPSQEALIALAGTKQADAYLTPLFDYLFGAHEYGGHAVLQAVRAGGSRGYAGAITVRKDSPIRDLAALAGKRVAFVDRYSTSGFILPVRTLTLAGTEVEPVFAGTPAAAVAELRAGRVDAAAVRANLVADAPDLVVLATTDPIPNEPVWIRADLAPDARDRLVRAFEALSTTPQGRAALAGVADIVSFVPVEPEVFSAVHDAVEQTGKRVADLVPGGWWVHHQNAVHPGDLGPY